HLHWLFRPRDEWVDGLEADVNARTPRERIMHTLKLHTALECNRLLGRQGPFWQDESYDHCVLDVDELERIIEYVEQNLVRARLVPSPENWFFSSAYERTLTGLPPGGPLLPGVGYGRLLAGQVGNLPHSLRSR